MVSRAGAALLAGAIASAVLGSTLDRPALVGFGLAVLFYGVLAALGMIWTDSALRSGRLRARRMVAGQPDGGASGKTPAGFSGGCVVLLGQELHITVALENTLRTPWTRLVVSDLLPRSLRTSEGRTHVVSLPARGTASFSYVTTAEVAGSAHLGGLEITATDPLDLFRRSRFLPASTTLDILPLPVEHGSLLSRVSSAQAGARRLVQKGLGSELHQIRDYVPGDSFRSIAWKKTARSGRLLTRETELELNVPCTMFIDASRGMRAGHYGRTKLDYVVREAAVLAASAAKAGDPCGFGAFSGDKWSYTRPGTGRAHLLRLLRMLAQLRGQMAEEDLPYPALSLFVQGYAHACDPTGILDARESWVPAAVLGWVAARYGLDAGERYRLGQDQGLARALLYRFCRDWGLSVPGQPVFGRQRPTGGRDQRLNGLFKLALARAKEREVFVVFSDFEGIEASPLLLEAFRLARARYHRVLLVSPFTPWFEMDRGAGESAGEAEGEEVPVAEAAEEMIALAFAGERAVLREAVRRLGIPVRDLAPGRISGAVLREVALLKQDRAVRV